MRNEFLSKVIGLLEENKRFPKYQMERRFDIFINLFLPNIIQWKFGKDYIIDFIIPELPIKKEGNNQSTNLDYLVVCKTQKKAFLVELKTDPNSCKLKQLEIYIEAQASGLIQIIKDIKIIYNSPNNHYQGKYEYLLSLLSPEKIDQNLKLELIYILPELGLQKLLKKSDALKKKVHFITLEILSTIQISGQFQEEWDIIRKSKLF
jgi:hypothetical protein